MYKIFQNIFIGIKQKYMENKNFLPYSFQFICFQKLKIGSSGILISLVAVQELVRLRRMRGKKDSTIKDLVPLFTSRVQRTQIPHETNNPTY